MGAGACLVSILGKAEGTEALRLGPGFFPESGSGLLLLDLRIYLSLADEQAHFEVPHEKDDQALQDLEAGGADSAIVVRADGDGEPFGEKVGKVHPHADNDDR